MAAAAAEAHETRAAVALLEAAMGARFKEFQEELVVALREQQATAAQTFDRGMAMLAARTATPEEMKRRQAAVVERLRDRVLTAPQVADLSLMPKYTVKRTLLNVANRYLSAAPTCARLGCGVLARSDGGF